MTAYKKILAPTDFSCVSDVAVQRAAQIAKANGASLTLLYVIEHFPEDIPIDRIGPEDEDPKEYLTHRALRQMEKLAAGLPGIEPRLEVIPSTRSAKAEIIRHASEQDVDLIVIGTHCGPGVLGMLGSTANGVMHAARHDVLVVRSGA
jgi:universal stress protein A